VDRHIQEFMTALDKFGLSKHTDVVIYGDHLTMGNVGSFLGADRNLTVLMPLRPQDEKWRQAQSKSMTYYDLAPTILEMLGISYSPPFPFGQDMLGPLTGKKPSLTELKMIYSITSGDMIADSVRCKNKSGFCQ
jgi:phosphoglycerol transferase MdoB-like AlkP superfamily enzyme